jgi:hypothetical protein
MYLLVSRLPYWQVCPCFQFADICVCMKYRQYFIDISCLRQLSARLCAAASTCHVLRHCVDHVCDRLSVHLGCHDGTPSKCWQHCLGDYTETADRDVETVASHCVCPIDSIHHHGLYYHVGPILPSECESVGCQLDSSILHILSECGSELCDKI